MGQPEPRGAGRVNAGVSDHFKFRAHLNRRAGVERLGQIHARGQPGVLKVRLRVRPVNHHAPQRHFAQVLRVIVRPEHQINFVEREVLPIGIADALAPGERRRAVGVERNADFDGVARGVRELIHVPGEPRPHGRAELSEVVERGGERGLGRLRRGRALKRWPGRAGGPRHGGRRRDKSVGSRAFRVGNGNQIVSHLAGQGGEDEQSQG